MSSQTAAREQPNSLFSVLGEILDFKITGEESGGLLSVIELTAFPQNGPPPHIHHREDESFYVIDGNFSFLFGDRTITAGSGFFCRVPKGTVHTYQNIGTRQGKALVILTPAGFEQLLQLIGRPIASLEAHPAPPNPKIIAQLADLAPKYGLELKMP